MRRAAGRAMIVALAAGQLPIPPVAAGPATLRPTLHACTYAYRDDMRTFARCASVDATGVLHLLPRHRARLIYDRNGLASLFVDRWYYVRRDGRSAPVMTFDNGPDDFAGGLVRSPFGGKLGYIDRRLRLVIPRRYDGAYPFDHGVAAVCIGCHVARAGEYTVDVGGSWGCIDRHGTLIGAMRRQARQRDCSPPR